LLTGQIDVENPDKNHRFWNIKSTVACKHHTPGDDGMSLSRKGQLTIRKLKSSFVTKSGCEGSTDVMLKVKAKAGSGLFSYFPVNACVVGGRDGGVMTTFFFDLLFSHDSYRTSVILSCG